MPKLTINILSRHTFTAFAVALCCSISFAQWTNAVPMPPPINENPPGEYYYTSVSADGNVLCLTINQAPNGFGDDDVYFSEKINDTEWSVPINAGPNINDVQRNLSPSITSDHQRMYYVRWTGSYDIYTSVRTGPDWDDWSPAVPLPAPVNEAWEFTAQIGDDDSTLIYTSIADRMYTSRLQSDGSWSARIAIAPHLNAVNGSRHPELVDNGSTLVFGQFGGIHFDVFYAHRGDSSFGSAIRCDSTINTPWWDSGPSCPSDGSLLYFESRRPDSAGVELARIFVADRLVSTGPTPRKAQIRTGLRVIPSYGDSNTLFTVQLPSNFRPEQILLYNILGQRLTSLRSFRFGQTIILTRENFDNLIAFPAGTYYVVAQSEHTVLASPFIVTR